MSQRQTHTICRNFVAPAIRHRASSARSVSGLTPRTTGMWWLATQRRRISDGEGQSPISDWGRMETDDAIHKLHQMIGLLVAALVDDPNNIQITATEGHSLVIFEIRCRQEEMGKIVGKSGRNIQALRTILSAVGAKHRKRVQVELIEPEPR
jgi:hypothetical protein